MYDPYHVYMDLDVMNNDYNSTSKPHLRFEETRNTPFYHATVQTTSAVLFASIFKRATRSLSLYLGFGLGRPM